VAAQPPDAPLVIAMTDRDVATLVERLTAALDQIEADIEADDRGVLNARGVLQLVRAALAEAQR
jgi:hypothetical protein